jgi:hypothetical protein
MSKLQRVKMVPKKKGKQPADKVEPLNLREIPSDALSEGDRDEQFQEVDKSSILPTPINTELVLNSHQSDLNWMVQSIMNIIMQMQS